MTTLCEMEFFNFLLLNWVHYLPLPSTKKDRRMSITCYPDKSFPDTCIQTLSLHKYMWQWILWHLFPDIQCSVTIESRQLFPDNWFQDTCFPTPVSKRNQDTCFPTPVSKRNQDTCFPTPVSKRNQDTYFPTPVSKRNQDTCFPTPVSWNHFQTPVSRHLFPPQKIRHLFPDTCFPPKNQTPVSGQQFPSFLLPISV
jgi:hypothetical protein